MRKPATAAAERQCVAVEEHDPADGPWSGERFGCGHPGAEGVSDEERTRDPEALLEAVEERQPASQ